MKPGRANNLAYPESQRVKLAKSAVSEDASSNKTDSGNNTWINQSIAQVEETTFLDKVHRAKDILVCLVVQVQKKVGSPLAELHRTSSVRENQSQKQDFSKHLQYIHKLQCYNKTSR